MRIPISDAQLEENPYLPPYYNPGQQDETIQYLLERRRALGGFLPERRTHHVGLQLPGRRRVRAAQEGLGHAGDRHDDGVRPPAEGPAAREGLRPPHRADHPRRGAHVRHGRVLPDGEDLQPERPALHLGRPRAAPGLQGEPAGPDHPRRHQRGRARWPRSPASAPRTRRTASRSSRSTSSTRCSASSAPATPSGQPATRWRAASSSAPPPAAPR